MPRTERLTGRRRVVVSIALGSEVDKFLLAVLASLDHLLLARPVRWDGAVALHRGLVSHISCIATGHGLS